MNRERRQLMRFALVACLTGVLATAWLLLPPAVTASVDLSVTTTEVHGSDKLVIRSEGGDTNIVFVRYQQPVYVIRSSESPLMAGPGCLIVDLDVAVCVGQIGSATILGGAGADVIDFAGVPVPIDGTGGPGDDALTGGTAANTLNGGDGIDQLTGGPRRDNLDGGDGDDWILGRADSDSLLGGSGNDIIESGTGDTNVLAGGTGRDLLIGGNGSDILEGDSGADVLVGGRGPDVVAPGTGADTVLNLRGADPLDCPAEVVDNAIRATSCAQIEKGAPPDAWPPTEAPASSTEAPAPLSASDHSHAVPVTAGQAIAVLVHVPADQHRRVRRCIRTYADAGRHVRLDAFRATFTARDWPKVYRPHPNRGARAARLTSARHCP